MRARERLGVVLGSGTPCLEDAARPGSGPRALLGVEGVVLAAGARAHRGQDPAPVRVGAEEGGLHQRRAGDRLAMSAGDGRARARR